MLSAANATCVGRREAIGLLGQALEAYAVSMQRDGFTPGRLAQSVESPRGVTALMNLSLSDARLPILFKSMYEAGLAWSGWPEQDPSRR